MTKLAALLLLFVGSACRLAHGQDPSPSGPPDPQLAPLPEKVTFEKQYAYVADRPLSASPTAEEKKLQQFMAKIAPPDRIAVTKDGQVRQVIIHTPDGISTESWLWGENRFTRVPNPPSILVSGPGMSSGTSGPSDELNSDFREANWVTRKLYVREEMVGGVKCYLYKDKDNRSAWIEETQRVPIAVQTPKMKVVFNYKAPPDHLELPDDLQKKWQQVRRAYSGMRLH